MQALRVTLKNHYCQMNYLQGHASLGGQTEHYLAQGSHTRVEAMREGGQGAGLQAPDAARRGAELRRGAGAQG